MYVENMVLHSAVCEEVKLLVIPLKLCVETFPNADLLSQDVKSNTFLNGELSLFRPC